jgi:hypothetical protein
MILLKSGVYIDEQGIGCVSGRFVQTNIVAKGCEDIWLDSFRYFGVTCVCVDGRPNVEPRAAVFGEKRGSLPGTIDPKTYRLLLSICPGSCEYTVKCRI